MTTKTPIEAISDAISSMYKGDASSDQAENLIARDVAPNDMAAFIVSAFKRGWISPRQESATIETLKLLQETVDYLNRLPVVPVTHALINKIQAHIDDPHVVAARREAREMEVLVSRRYGSRYAPSGAPAYLAVVDGNKVTFHVPAYSPKLEDGSVPEDHRMQELAKGVTLGLWPKNGE